MYICFASTFVYLLAMVTEGGGCIDHGEDLEQD